MADLPTNFLDDILSASMNGKKKFRLTYRNGTTEEVTIEDRYWNSEQKMWCYVFHSRSNLMAWDKYSTYPEDGLKPLGK